MTLANDIQNGLSSGSETEVVDQTENLNQDAALPTTDPPTTKSEVAIDWGRYPRTMAEKVESLNTGDPAGIGQWRLGTGRHNEPVIMTEDDQGRMQFLTVTDEKWMAIKQAQEENNAKVRQYEKEQQELTDAITENQGAFEYGLQNLDDGSNPMFSAALKDAYQKDPINTLKMMYDLQRLEDRDSERAAQIKWKIGNDNAYQRSAQVAQQTIDSWSTHYKNQLDFYESQLSTDPNADNTVHSNAKRHLMAHADLASRAASFKPHQGMDMSLSPGVALGNPYMAKECYKTWLQLLELGVPQVGQSPVQMSITDRDSDNSWEANAANVMQHLQWLSSQFGWQAPIELDMVAIQQAFKEHVGNKNLQVATEGQEHTVVEDDPTTQEDETQKVTMSTSPDGKHILSVAPYADQGGITPDTAVDVERKTAGEAIARTAAEERALNMDTVRADLQSTTLSNEQKVLEIQQMLEKSKNPLEDIKTILDGLEELRGGDATKLEELKISIMEILDKHLRELDK